MPTSWNATGRPSCEKPQGRVTVGTPAAFKGEVKQKRAFASPAMAARISPQVGVINLEDRQDRDLDVIEHTPDAACELAPLPMRLGKIRRLGGKTGFQSLANVGAITVSLGRIGFLMRRRQFRHGHEAVPLDQLLDRRENGGDHVGTEGFQHVDGGLDQRQHGGIGIEADEIAIDADLDAAGAVDSGQGCQIVRQRCRSDVVSRGSQPARTCSMAAQSAVERAIGPR